MAGTLLCPDQGGCMSDCTGDGSVFHIGIAPSRHPIQHRLMTIQVVVAGFFRMRNGVMVWQPDEEFGEQIGPRTPVIGDDGYPVFVDEIENRVSLKDIEFRRHDTGTSVVTVINQKSMEEYFYPDDENEEEYGECQRQR